jgi:hypothetical protein
MEGRKLLLRLAMFMVNASYPDFLLSPLNPEWRFIGINLPIKFVRSRMFLKYGF